MCTGHSLRNVIPTEDEYERVEDVECLETLRYIFKRNKQGHLTHSIKKVCSLNCLVLLAILNYNKFVVVLAI